MADDQLVKQIRQVVKEEIAENQKKNDGKFSAIDKRFDAQAEKFASIDKSLKYIKRKVRNLDKFDRFIDREHQETKKRLDRVERYLKLPQN